MPAKIYQRILQFGVFASLGVVFLLFSNLLFPYIASKQLTFNILIEILLPFWLILIWKFPQFRPQKSWVTWGILAYLAAILLSSITGVDFNLSFWGDVERLLGVFHVFHFFLFYLYIITAFRDKEDWYWLLCASVFVAAIEAIIIIRGAAMGTIGNTAYVSGYMLFNLYFTVILLLRTAWKKQWPLYISLILILIAFFKADTSGAIVGLGASLLFLLFLLGLFASRKKLRRTSLFIFIIGVAGVLLLFSQYQQPWFKASPVLNDLSFNKNTFQTRRLSWEGAARDFHLHPWLGTGFGNYAIIFDRQFDPTFYNYALTETYFDRAHNNLIDIASTAGIIGLITYLSIFIAAAWEWRRSLRLQGGLVLPGREGMPVRELLVLAALLLAYFIQNLAVFDSLVTYMGLMITLAYLVFLSPATKNVVASEEEKPELIELPQSPRKEFSLLALTLIMAIVIIISCNLRPWLMLKRVIIAYTAVAQGQITTAFSEYHQALALDTPLDRDARMTLISIVNNNPTIFTQLPESSLFTELEYSSEVMADNLAYNPNDSLTQMQAAQLYDITARYYYDQPASFKTYSDKALEAINKSLAASPQRIPIYFVKAQIETNRGDLVVAEQSLLTAYNLNPNYPDTSCQLANHYFLTEKKLDQNYVDECLDKQGTALRPEILQESINYYQEQEDAERLVEAYRLLVKKSKQEALVYVQLAQAELAVGNVEAALEAAVTASEIDPSLRSAVQTFLQSLPALEE